MPYRKEKLGVVLVDSGKLMMIDPLFLSELKQSQPKRIYKDTQSGKMYEYGIDFHNFTDKILENATAAELIESGRFEAMLSSSGFSTGSMIEQLAENGVWQGAFENMQAGKALAVIAEDGVYEVVAEYDGDVLKKISIEF